MLEQIRSFVRGRLLLWFVGGLLGGAALGFLLITGGPARANGVPLHVPLAYLPGLSNWGPTDAHGTAELSYAEGLLNVEAEGLPVLGDQVYAAWLVNTTTNRALAAGTFQGNSTGTATLDGKLTGLTSYDYDLVIITVEPPVRTGAPTPSTQRSIGGYFTSVQATQPPAAGIGADTQPGGLTGQTMPETLPNTGDLPPPQHSSPSSSMRSKLAAALFGVGGLSLWASFRRRRMRA